MKQKQQQPRSSSSSSALEKVANQVWLLLWKQLLLWWRCWPTTLVRLLWPGLAVLLWWLAFFYNSSSGGGGEGVTPAVFSSRIPRCTRGLNASDTCVTLLFDSCGDEAVRQRMRIIAAQNDPPLSMSDVPCDSSPSFDVVGVRYFSAATLGEQSNHTQAAIQWTDWNGEMADDCHDCTPDSPLYSVWHPDAVDDPFMLRSVSMFDIKSEVLLAVDAALITEAARAHFGSSTLQTTLRYTLRSAPTYSDSVVDSDWRLSLLPLLLFIVVFGDSFAIASGLNFDRQSEIRQGLRMMGLQTGPYWTAWFLTQALWGVPFSLVVGLVGIITGTPLFSACNFLLLLILLWLGYMCMSTVTLWLCALIHHPIANISVIVLGALFGVMMLLLSSFFPYWFFGLSKISDIIWAFAYPLHLGRISSEILTRQREIDENSSMPLYSWRDLATNTSLIWPASHNVGFMVMDVFVGILFAFYFDSVWPGATGIPRKMLFFLQPSYWVRPKFREPTVELEAYDPKKISSVLESLDPDVQREHGLTMARAKEKDERAVISILQLSKTFKKGRGASSQDCRALDSFTAVADQGTVFAILGHNGAGKTTTINLLTGVYPPTFGDAFICGHSIIDGMADIQSFIGVCPQKDIVWPALTGEEHLRVFCMLKGVPRDQRARVIAELAAKVRLTKYIKRRVETYSGGMKRRLSVAIAMVGEPALIFLDEPTSGLDPKNRREMWSVINDLKAGRLVVLTTHQMSEAEALADKVCILALGRLRAVGSTLHLKQRYGAGYRLSAIVDASDAEEVKSAIASLVPNATLESETGGHLLFSVELIQSSAVTNILHFFESRSASGQIKDWGLTQTSLEEIFLRVTHGMHSEKDRAALDTTSEVQLNIMLDDESAAAAAAAATPLGFIRATRMVTLSEARRMIELVEAAPKNYIFICNGAPVSAAQEAQIFAADLSPTLVLRPLPATSSSGATAGSEQSAELLQRIADAEAGRDAALKAMRAAQAEAEHANDQLREMAERIAALEARLAAVQQQ